MTVDEEKSKKCLEKPPCVHNYIGMRRRNRKTNIFFFSSFRICSFSVFIWSWKSHYSHINQWKCCSTRCPAFTHAKGSLLYGSWTVDWWRKFLIQMSCVPVKRFTLEKSPVFFCLRWGFKNSSKFERSFSFKKRASVEFSWLENNTRLFSSRRHRAEWLSRHFGRIIFGHRGSWFFSTGAPFDWIKQKSSWLFFFAGRTRTNTR